MSKFSPLLLPSEMPCVKELAAETFTLHNWREAEVGKRVLFLNLMPQKEVTELDIARTLASASDCAVQLLPMKIAGQEYKNTSADHMDACYLDFEEYADDTFSHFIVTGAPLEQMPFEYVRYWPQLQRIMRWADSHVAHTLYICWGAQAGLYEFYGIQKHDLPNKMFGIFSQNVLCPASPLMQGLTPAFLMPNSRHTEVKAEDIALHASEGLQLLAQSEESGVGVAATADCKRTFIVGHLEYEPLTLHNEYHRDLSKGLPIEQPRHYYAPDGTVNYSWQQSAQRFYANWLAL